MYPGQRLRKLRVQARMTQAQLAQKLGVTEFTVCRYEKGRIGMPVNTIKKAAAIFDACPVYFLSEVECRFGRDQELAEIFRRADQLDAARRELIKQTLRALLAALPSDHDPRAGADD